jgi:hypothetical protein
METAVNAKIDGFVAPTAGKLEGAGGGSRKEANI